MDKEHTAPPLHAKPFCESSFKKLGKGSNPGLSHLSPAIAGSIPYCLFDFFLEVQDYDQFSDTYK